MLKKFPLIAVVVESAVEAGFDCIISAAMTAATVHMHTCLEARQRRRRQVAEAMDALKNRFRISTSKAPCHSN